MSDAADALARHLVTSLMTSHAADEVTASEQHNAADEEDLACARCCGVLVDPVTAQCGHSFCRRCSVANVVLSYNDACPRCSCDIAPRGFWQPPGSHLTTAGGGVGGGGGGALETDILVRSLVERWWAPEIRAARLVPEVERLLIAGNDQRALRMCDEGLQHAPEYSPLLVQRSMVFARLGDFRRALQDADEVIRLRPTWPVGYYRRGSALSGLGLAEEALVAHCVGASLDRDPFVATTDVSELLHRILSPVSASCATRSRGRPLAALARRCSLRSTAPSHSLHHHHRRRAGNTRTAGSGAGPPRGLIRRLRQELEKCKRLSPRPLLLPVDPLLIEQSDFDCVLCCRTLLKPAVTPCGHTYCRTCLERCLDYSPACPLCMRPLSDYQSLGRRPPTKFLEAAMRHLIPRQYATRRGEDESQKEARLPVFVCTTAYPTVPCPLFVSEPRYRLMVRRCIESGSRRFGIASCLNNPRLGSRQKLADYGTLLEVRDHVLLSNGSSILTAVGSKRFRIVERDEKDGYDLARVEFIADDPVSGVHELSDLHDKVREEAMRWFGQMAENIRAEIRRSFGEIPEVEEDWMSLPDGPAWAWWILAILPLGPQLQVGVLSSTSLEKRLRAIDKTLEYIRFRRVMESRQDDATEGSEDVVVSGDGAALWQTGPATASCQTARETDLATSMDL